MNKIISQGLFSALLLLTQVGAVTVVNACVFQKLNPRQNFIKLLAAGAAGFGA